MKFSAFSLKARKKLKNNKRIPRIANYHNNQPSNTKKKVIVLKKLAQKVANLIKYVSTI